MADEYREERAEKIVALFFTESSMIPKQTLATPDIFPFS